MMNWTLDADRNESCSLTPSQRSDRSLLLSILVYPIHSLHFIRFPTKLVLLNDSNRDKYYTVTCALYRWKNGLH